MADLTIDALHRAALERTRTTVAGIIDADWPRPTPCEDWDVRTLLNHVVSGNFWAARLGAGETIAHVGDALDGDVLGAEPLATYDASAAVAAAVFERPGALEAPCAVSYGPVPGSVYAGHRFLDVLVHGWDLAAGTDQDRDLPEDLVVACWEIMEPQLDMVLTSGMFGEHHDVPAGAPPQERLLRTLGRDPDF